MTLDRQIRAIAGAFILVSLALAHWVDARFLWFTAFVGANLLQSSFTHWCLMEDILRKLGTAPPTSSGGSYAPSAPMGMTATPSGRT